MNSRLIAILGSALAGSLILGVAVMLSGDGLELGDAGEPRPGVGPRPGGAVGVSRGSVS